MPSYNCPYPNCDYQTEDITDQLASTLLGIHASGAHTPSAPDATPPTTQLTAKLEKVCRPTITAAGSSEEWSYFLTCWGDYIESTKVTGKDRVIQLLEC